MNQDDALHSPVQSPTTTKSEARVNSIVTDGLDHYKDLCLTRLQPLSGQTKAGDQSYPFKLGDND